MAVSEMSIGYVRFNPNPVGASSPTLASVQVLENVLTWGDLFHRTWGQVASLTW